MGEMVVMVVVIQNEEKKVYFDYVLYYDWSLTLSVIN